MTTLKNLWSSLLGNPPEDEQFTVWSELYTPEVIRQAIVKTAAKNLSLGKTMSLDYKTRFASRVMIVQTERNREHAANRERIAQQFGAGDVASNSTEAGDRA